MSKYVALYRADAKNSGCIFWITIFEQETVCGSELNTLGITVLFKWEQIQRSLHLSSVFLIPRRKKKATPSFGIDPEQPWNAEHLTAPDVYLCVLGRCIQIQTRNLPGLRRTRCHSYRIFFFFPGSSFSVSTLRVHAPAVPRGRIIASVFLTLYLISAWASQTPPPSLFSFPAPLIYQETRSRLPGLLPKMPFFLSADLEEGWCSRVVKSVFPGTLFL